MTRSGSHTEKHRQAVLAFLITCQTQLEVLKLTAQNINKE